MEHTQLSNHFQLSEFLNLSKYPDNIPSQRRVARGLRRVADGAQRQGHLLAALCRKARGKQAENKADCLLTECHRRDRHYDFSDNKKNRPQSTQTAGDTLTQ